MSRVATIVNHGSNGDDVVGERVVDSVGEVIQQNAAEASVDLRAGFRMLL
jgi:hypothetical protein